MMLCACGHPISATTVPALNAALNDHQAWIRREHGDDALIQKHRPQLVTRASKRNERDS
jgi:hypothetical protein